MSSGACCWRAPSKKEGLGLVSFWILEIDVEASISIKKKKKKRKKRGLHTFHHTLGHTYFFKVRLQVLNARTVARHIRRRWWRQTRALANHRQAWSCVFGNLTYRAVLFATAFARVLQALPAMHCGVFNMKARVHVGVAHALCRRASQKSTEPTETMVFALIRTV